MYKTLAFRNMKRQLRNYLIYFVTIAMTISLIFAMNNMIYNKDLQDRADNFTSLSTGLLVLSGFLCVVIAIVLGYANAYILRLRKREFGTYLTLGMKRPQIVKLFLLENSFLGILAILVGFIFGSLLYQGLMVLMSNLLDYPFSFSFISIKGVIVTMIMIVLIFVATFVSSSMYLKRVTIYELVYGEQKVQKVQSKPILSFVMTIIAAALMVYAFIRFSSHLEGVFKSENGSEIGLLIMIALLAISLIVFHVGLAKSLMYVLLKSKLLRGKGTNQFILRQLSASLSANSLLLGLLAFLISFSIIATNTGFLYKAVEEANIEKRYPFDVMGNETIGEETPVSPQQAVEAIEQYTTIEQSFKTPFFTSGVVDFLKQTAWYDENYTDKDVYMRESDLNKLLQAIGEQPITLKGEYAIYSDSAIIESYDFSEQTITVNGKDYSLKQVETTLPAFVWAYFVIVVPDEVVEGMQHVQTAYAWNVIDPHFDAAALHQALSYQEPYNNYFVQRTDYRIQSYERMSSMAFSAIFIVGALYLGFVFILLAMAILALKTLSAISDDEKRYRILHRIGVSRTTQTATLAKQILAFFAFPVAVPVLLAIPISLISEQVIQLMRFGEQLNMYLLSGLIVAVIVMIYSLYFIVTFAITKKHVVS
ncbi:ABC transporter permease [Lysinibacillus sp. NPDC097287]|uniref:ABC transporter permease n=1 Tax=Lysinibacillus sp. NPDC097287 TaxID=3364144 RepID=UPI0038290AE1